jgi:hypothetical protein
MPEYYQELFQSDDPYGLDQYPEMVWLNKYKLEMLCHILPQGRSCRYSLDVGGGDAGIFLSHPQCRGTRLSIHVDISANAVRRARQHYNAPNRTEKRDSKSYYKLVNHDQLTA